jgi:2-polyprenyl-3-methyl-5-hydroxy-6-metoxy-1,4-benzoquinol methylase
MAREDWERHYERYSPTVPLRLGWKGLWTRSKLHKVSLLNRQRDYMALAGDPRRLELHRRLNACLDRATREWESYDYGEGYFYQSLAAVGVSGLRDTEARLLAMGLADRVAGRRVLEIGCNTGFVSLSIADVATQVTGFDLNPHLIDVADAAAEYLEIANVRFSVASFEDFSTEERFDTVLSFANHSTYDGNTSQSIEEYLRRCRDLLEPGGSLLFESHPPAHEGDGLEGVCALVAGLFEVQERRVLDYGSFLDGGRTFIDARRVD